jgi:hypothetical protein
MGLLNHFQATLRRIGEGVGEGLAEVSGEVCDEVASGLATIRAEVDGFAARLKASALY